MDPRRKAALTAGTVGIAILAAGDAANFYSGALPSWFTISSPFMQDQGARKGNVKRIRQGEAFATALSLMVGVGASIAAGSPLPFWATVAVSAAMVAGYEYALRHPSSQES